MTNDKTTNLILQLTKMTINKEISWEALNPPRGFDIGSEDIVPMLYVTKIKEKTVAVYLRRYRHFTDIDEFHWAEKVCIAFLSNDLTTIIWEPNERSASIVALYQTVTEQASGIDDLLNDLLKDEW